MSAFLDNAIESVRVGIDFYLNRPERSAHKHATLLLFHAIELLLKERLNHVHVSLTYRCLDEPITEDTPTVSIEQALIRLQNLGVAVDLDQAAVLQDLQRRRNWIERHAYDRDPDDGAAVSQAVGFIAYFLREFLGMALEDQIDVDLLARVSGLSHDTSREGGPETELFADVTKVNCGDDGPESSARDRVDAWIRENCPNDGTAADGKEDPFPGTVSCPACLKDFVLMKGHPAAPYCFFCQAHIDAACCECCGSTYLRASGPRCACDLRDRT
jgi:hypothetical protein